MSKKKIWVLVTLVCVLFVSCSSISKEVLAVDSGLPDRNVKDFGNIAVFLTESARTVYRISASPEDGYCINAYLVVPTNRALEHLLVHPVKIGKEQPYEKSDKEVQDIVKTKRYHGYRVDNLVNPVSLYLALPETKMQDGFRHLSLDKTALLGNDEFKHLDLQVCRVLDAALSFLREELKIDLPDKVDMSGYSGEGEFIVRFALLHPQRLHAVCAGGISWSPALPLAELYGSKIDYPLGVNDIEKYSDDFDLNAWKEIKFFIDMGMKDDRGSYNKGDLNNLKWTKNLEYQAIWLKFCDAYANTTENAELVSYSNLNHTYIEEDYASFLLANDGDLFVKTYPTQNAFIISSEGTEYYSNPKETAQNSRDVSGLKASDPYGTYFSGCGNGTYTVTYNGEPVFDYTFEVSDPSYGTVTKNGDGSLTLYAEKENAVGTYVTLRYKGESFKFHWYRPSAKP